MSSQVRPALISETENALRVVSHRSCKLVSQGWPGAVPTLLSVAQSDGGSNSLESLSKFLVICRIDNGLTNMLDDLASFSDIIDGAPAASYLRPR